MTADPKTAMLIRRAKRVSDFLGAECFAVAVEPTGDLSGLPQAEREAMEQHLNFARNLHIETRILEGDDIAATLVDSLSGNSGVTLSLSEPILPETATNLANYVVTNLTTGGTLVVTSATFTNGTNVILKVWRPRWHQPKTISSSSTIFRMYRPGTM